MCSFWIMLLVSLYALTYCLGNDLNDECTNKVVGGIETSIESNPWQVAIFRRNSAQEKYRFVCGGSIIGNIWILTAAHCIRENTSPSDVLIRVGSSLNLKQGFLFKVKRIIPHENYNRTVKHDYDFALFELNEPFRYSESINKIALPDADVIVPDGTDCQISGWGDTKDVRQSHDKLRLACIPTVNHQKCNERYMILKLPITERMICAGLTGIDSCQGDSGGPFTCSINDTRLLIGVVSWGIGCADAFYAGINARVTVVRDWIKEHSGI